MGNREKKMGRNRTQALSIKTFSTPDDLRTFEKGKFELVEIGGMTLGRATYEPGWKWSEHVGKALGKKLCDVAHIGMVVSGRAMVVMEDGKEFEITAGDIFEIPPGHDSWVAGDELYVSIHLVGAEHYTK